MPLRAVHNLSLADQVFEQLVTEIVEQRYAAGASLPAERALAEVFGVNRHVVREALKRLAQIGLVKISQGGGTQVLDWKRSAGLDMLAMMAEHARGGADVAGYWLAVLEMRAAIAADMARLCARRADAQVRKDVVAIAREMAEAGEDQLFALEVRFWDRVLDGADNIAYRLAFNSMLKGAHATADLARQWSAYEARSSGYRTRIAAAIAAGDAATAESETRDAMRAAVERFARGVTTPREPPARARRTPAARRAAR
jgi:DNA-binding FadR family transcriptional regulator